MKTEIVPLSFPSFVSASLAFSAGEKSTLAGKKNALAKRLQIFAICFCPPSKTHNLAGNVSFAAVRGVEEKSG